MAAALGWSGVATGALAHHGWSSFDQTRPIYLEGKSAHAITGDDGNAPLAGYYFNFRKTSIYGGSNEIQKNIITQMILEEQQQFADALRRWVDKDYGFEARKRIIHSPSGVSDQAWATLAELGMLALPVPEEQGGFNGSAVDMLVVMQELGRGLVM
eukprot:gene358-401_t